MLLRRWITLRTLAQVNVCDCFLDWDYGLRLNCPVEVKALVTDRQHALAATNEIEGRTAH